MNPSVAQLHAVFQCTRTRVAHSRAVRFPFVVWSHTAEKNGKEGAVTGGRCDVE